MSQIVVKFDTKSKKLDVTMDGKSLDNVNGVEIYKDYGGEDFHGSITMVEKVDDDDVTKVMRIHAKDDSITTTTVSNVTYSLAKKLFPKKMV
jgi:hypothetical protein